MRTCHSIATAVLLGVMILPASARAQKTMNLGFELRSFTASTLPWGWTSFSPGIRADTAVTLDQRVRRTGERSLRIERGNASDRFHLIGMPVERPKLVVAGKRVRVSGWIRTEALASGQAGLFVEVWRRDGPARLDTLLQSTATGSTGWTYHRLEVAVDSAVTSMGFGAHVSGAGVAWFDDLEVEIDGKRLESQATDNPPVPAQEIEWLRRSVATFSSIDPDSGAADLAPLRAIVSGARIIGLGEATHGTSEFQRMKHRITEYLVRELGVTVFAIETDQLQAERLNRYLTTGEGDPRLAMTGFYNMWQTREMLDMVQWMRRYNASGAGRLEFVGFDIIDPRPAMDSAVSFLRAVDPAFASVADSAYRDLRGVIDREQFIHPDSTAAPRERNAAIVTARLKARRDDYSRVTDTTRFARALQHANLVLQSAGLLRPGNFNRTAFRDSCMTENLLWELSRRPAGTRAVVSAHNEHVAKRDVRMGGFLAGKLGNEYRSIGFATFQGTYSGDTSPGRPLVRRSYVPTPLYPAPEGSVEGMLHSLGRPRLLIDLRSAGGNQTGQAFGENREFRSISAAATNWGFLMRAEPLSRVYDGLIFIDETKGTTILPCPRNLVCGG